MKVSFYLSISKPLIVFRARKRFLFQFLYLHFLVPFKWIYSSIRIISVCYMLIVYIARPVILPFWKNKRLCTFSNSPPQCVIVSVDRCHLTFVSICFSSGDKNRVFISIWKIGWGMPRGFDKKKSDKLFTKDFFRANVQLQIQLLLHKKHSITQAGFCERKGK